MVVGSIPRSARVAMASLQENPQPKHLTGNFNLTLSSNSYIS